MITLSGIRRVCPMAVRTRERVIAAIARARIGGAISEECRGDIATERLANRNAAGIETGIGESRVKLGSLPGGGQAPLKIDVVRGPGVGIHIAN